MNTSAVYPPPGWYDDGSGHQRWWDGQAWGPYAASLPPPPNGAQSTTLAVLSHVSLFFAGLVLPLVVYLVSKDDRFTRANAREALNFQITFLIVWLSVVAGAVFAGTLGSTTQADGTSNLGHPALFAAFFAVGGGAYIFAAVVSIRGAIVASRREQYRYPISLRFVGRKEAAAEAATTPGH
jgi:uncharacterized Tic20 family protein